MSVYYSFNFQLLIRIFSSSLREQDKYTNMRNALILTICLFFISFTILYASNNRANKIKQLKDSLLLVQDSLKFEITEDIADELYFSGKLLESAEMYKEARIFEEKSQKPLKKRIATSYSNEAYCYREIGYYNNAISLFNKALTLFTEIEDLEEIAIQNYNIGVSWFNLGSYEKCIEYYQKALEIDILRNDTNGIGYDYSIIGNVFMEWEQYDQALNFLRKSLEIAKKLENEEQKSIRYGKIGQTYTHIQQYDSALFYFEKSLPYIKQLEVKDQLASRLTQLGNVYYNLGDYSTADNYYNEVILFVDKIEQLKTKAILYSNYGRNCLKLNKTDIGISYLLKSLELCQKVKHNQTAQNSYKYLLDYYYASGNYKQAFDYYVKFNQLKDSSFTENNQKKLAEFQALFETQQKEATIKDLEQKHQLNELKLNVETNKRNFAIVFALIAIIGLFTLVVISRKLKSKNAELQRLNSILKKMFSIISHDLRSSISSFQSAGRVLNYHLKNGEYKKMAMPANEVSKNSQHLSLMLDNLLNWSLSQIKRKQIVAQETNVYEIAEFELELFKSASEVKHTELVNSISKEHVVFVDKQHFSIILRNLIGNAVKFTQNGVVTLSSEKQNDKLLISVSDTGTGMDKDLISGIFEISESKTKRGTNNEKGTGLGLNLVKEYVELNKGSIKVESKKNKGTKFTLYLPAKISNGN